MRSSLKREIQFYKDIKNSLYKKYYFSPDMYNKSIITNILYNQKYHIVSLFKEILIYDDPGEFFKRFYYLNESILKIKTYCDFYEKNSKIFPNYIILSESKIIFKNIKKKQKMLDNLNDDNNNLNINIMNNNNNENNFQNNEEIFSKTIMNSILSDNSSQSSSNDKSIRKLIKKICDYENQYLYNENNENELSNLENNNKYIYVNSSKIDYNLNKNHLIKSTNKHHCKKFIKEFKFASKLINCGIKKINEKKNSKQNLSGLNNVYPLKKSNDKNNTNNKYKQNDKIEVSKILKHSNNKIEDKSKSKSRSKNKDFLTERNNKSKSNNTNNSIQKKTGIQKKIKKPLIYINNINENNSNKEETKSMPKLITSLNKTTGINKIKTQHKTLFSANNKKYNKQTNNNYYNNHIKSSLRFTNIKLQKHSSNFEIQFHNAPLSNYITKHIPSLHISLNNNFKNTSTLSKSKSKSKSNSKSKSKSPNNTSNSFNRKFKNHYTITSFNKNFKYISNNIRTLIHKDILFSSDEGLQTERLKYKNNTNPIKSISFNNNTKKNLNINNNINNNKNIVKRNIHKKIISVTPSIEYTKIIPKTTREIKSNYLTSISGSLINKSKFSKENLTSGNKILNSFENKNKLLNSPLNKRKSINDKNNSNKIKKRNNQDIIGFINSRRSSINKTNNLLYSHNYSHHPVKRIRNFDNINILTKIKSPKKKYNNNNINK